jgi:hypothetical protein
MKLTHIVAAAAILAAGAANAAVTGFDGGAVNGNSSVMLVMLDSTGGTTRGLTVDLGYNYQQANYSAAGATNVFATTAWNAPDTQLNWDFAGNTITQTNRQTGATAGVSGAADNAWSTQVADFLANADLSEVKFALVAGSRKGSAVSAFLATGTPNATQLGAQNPTATSGMQLVDPLFSFNNTAGTHATATNGAYSMAATDDAFVGTNYHGTTDTAGWKNNLKWDGWTALGGQTNLRQLNATGQEFVIADAAKFVGGVSAYDLTGLLNGFGTFSVAADGLSAQWITAASPVPEPSTYAMTLVGLLGVAALARRRRA